MKLDIPIAGVTGEMEGNTVVIRSESPLTVLSSAVLNGGLSKSQIIINQQLTEDNFDPEGVLRSTINHLNLSPEDVIGSTTVVETFNLKVVTHQNSGSTVIALVTIGVSHPAAAGRPSHRTEKLSITLNIILLIDGNLTERCLVNAVKIVTDAKYDALRELDFTNVPSGKSSTGSASEDIVIACTGFGKLVETTEDDTSLIESIMNCTKKATKEILKERGLTPDRSLIHRLEERGITINGLVKTALELYCPHSGLETKEKASKLIKKEFKQILSDINIAALTIAGLRLEEDGQHGLLPLFSKQNFQKDPSYLVADEILGMAIANYIAGTRAIFEYIRFDKAKPGILQKLGPFLDDVMGGIIAGVSSNVYTKALNEQ